MECNPTRIAKSDIVSTIVCLTEDDLFFFIIIISRNGCLWEQFTV